MPGDRFLERVLFVDLSKRQFRVEERPALFSESLGGSGVAIRLLEELCPPGADPMGPDNPVILAVGPLVGYYPLASKTVAMFKSPHTGNLGESHAGGRSAVALRMAGYGAVVITGQSATPVYLVIDADGVQFRDASALWGVQSSYTVGSVLRERESGTGLRSIMRIGRAGERGVSYACVITETYRHFGRLGLGAVWGAKRLKAVVVEGKRSLPAADKRAYRRTYDAIYESATRSPLMKKYHDLGTPMNVLPLNELGALPTRNLQSARFEGAASISGEALAERYLGRRVACAHCPVACIHLATLRTPYPNEPYFFKTQLVGYDHEPIYACGSMLGLSDVNGMLELLDEIEVLGLDAMSAGVALAWATEALSRGLITLADTDSVPLEFGQASGYVDAVKRIVSQPTEFYRALAHGVDRASSMYGGADYALAFGGNEMAGYHTGPGCHAGWLAGARQSHLDNAGYGIDQKLAQSGKTLTPSELGSQLVAEERWRQVLTSLVVCLFARNVYDAQTVLAALQAIGREYTLETLNEAGAETLWRKHAYKEREGFDMSRLRIPARISETPSSLGQVDAGYIREVLAAYRSQL
jgi:aldehyde:ferredoxin oxidoreductase